MRLWFGALVLGVAATTIWACGDDDATNDAARDAGVDAGSGAYVPPPPLACSSIGAFDPCANTSTLPVTITARIVDGGVLDASPATPSDGACVASNAVQIACADGGAQFDLAAGDAGTSLALAWTANGSTGSRFTIGDDGTTTPPAAIPTGYDSNRIVNGALGAATVHARTDTVEFRRDFVASDSLKGFVKPELNGYTPLRQVLTDRVGDLHVLGKAAHPPSADYFHLDAQSTGDNVTLLTSGWTDLAIDSKNVVSGIFVGSAGELSYGSLGAEGATAIDDHALAFRFAFGANDRPLVASLLRGVLTFHTTLAADPKQWVRIDLDQSGDCDHESCPTACDDTHRLFAGSSGPSGDFVTTENGRSFFVYADAVVSRQLQCRTDVGIVCGIFGGCGCSCTTDVQSVTDASIVLLELDLAQYVATERTRVRLPFVAPKSMFALRNSDGTAMDPPAVTVAGDRQVFASARGNLVHVGVQDGAGELARVVLDLSR